ncbi:MAG: SGNH/GDSL hydrolase family protein [Elusimicrobia bacterium]|nr:SGNH/GDSL hydrolase family protein [Elusimicrobiota bacterium]
MASETSLRAKLILIGFSTLLALLALEHLVRFLPDAQTMLVRPSSIPGVGYQLVGNMTANSAYGRFPINRWGFRGPEYPMEKPPGVFRILTLGDSVMYGDSAHENDVTQSLGRLLEGSRPKGFSARVHTVNTSVPSYSTCQELALLEGWADGFSPDIVLVGYVMNDAEGTRVPFGLDLRTGRIPAYYRAYHYVKQRLYLVKYIVAKLSPFVFRLRGGFKQFGAADSGSPADYAAALHDPKGSFWPPTGLCIDGLGRYQRQKKVPVLFAIFPLLKNLHEPKLEGVYLQIEGRAKAAGLQTVNLYPYFTALNPEQAAEYAGDGMHPSEKGHLFIAGVIHRWLMERPQLLSGRGRFQAALEGSDPLKGRWPG